MLFTMEHQLTIFFKSSLKAFFTSTFFTRFMDIMLKVRHMPGTMSMRELFRPYPLRLNGSGGKKKTMWHAEHA